MRVISVQSQVALGHVGNSAAAFALMAAGVEVAAVPTTLFSNHPRYPTLRGRVLEPDLLADLLLGLEERGLPATSDWLITGYLGSAANAAVVGAFARRAQAANPGLRWLCDPVMGDADTGFFVPPDLARVFRDDLAPAADMITPNQFELAFLTGAAVDSPARALAAARSCPARTVIVTGAVFDDPEVIHTLLVAPEGAWSAAVPRVDRRPGGAGDLFAALFVAARARGDAPPAALARAVSGVHAALRATPAGLWPEMPLVAARAAILDPDPVFAAVALG